MEELNASFKMVENARDTLNPFKIHFKPKNLTRFIKKNANKIFSSFFQVCNLPFLLNSEHKGSLSTKNIKYHLTAANMHHKSRGKSLNL